MEKIYKVAAMVFRDNKFLMVKKTGKDIWTNLGGRPEGDESEERTLKREVMEELGCEIKIIDKLGEFENKAVHDNAIVRISAYRGELVGEPKISDDEIEEFGWIDKDWQKNGIKLPPSISEQIIPYCVKNKLLNW